MANLVEIGLVVLERKILCFHYFIIISTQLESPSPKDAPCLILVETGPVVLEKKIKM